MSFSGNMKVRLGAEYPGDTLRHCDSNALWVAKMTYDAVGSVNIRVRNLVRPVLNTIDPGRRVRLALSALYRRPRYFGFTIRAASFGNLEIKKRLLEGAPLAAGKFGAGESRLFRFCRPGPSGLPGVVPQSFMTQIYVQAGLFPRDQETMRWFTRLYADVGRDVDLLGIWFQDGESDLIRDNNLEATCAFFGFTGLEPYYFDEPWSHALKGRKVLVISPFSASIARQYERRDKIWPNGLLPHMELSYLTFPHSKALADNDYSSWREIYETFCKQMEALDFDVALVGAGAASLPLAVHAKRLGRQGIGLGGSLQLMFGITGRRWETHPFFAARVNEYWVRPSGNEVPGKRELVENGAYW